MIRGCVNVTPHHFHRRGDEHAKPAFSKNILMRYRWRHALQQYLAATDVILNGQIIILFDAATIK